MLPNFNLTWGRIPALMPCCNIHLLTFLHSHFAVPSPSLFMSLSCHTVHPPVFLCSGYTAPPMQLVFMCLHTTALGLLGPLSASPLHPHSNHHPVGTPAFLIWDSCHFFKNPRVLGLPLGLLLPLLSNVIVWHCALELHRLVIAILAVSVTIVNKELCVVGWFEYRFSMTAIKLRVSFYSLIVLPVKE